VVNGVLYVSYDGMLEPLGQSQVIAYLERLAMDRPIHLLSFEKPADWANDDARALVSARLAAAGIRWHPRRYHKHPSSLATAWDIGVGIVIGIWLVLAHNLRAVHARSYVPAVIALVLKRVTGARFVFDMRGFWVDERVDGGLWPRDGRMYRVAKWFERRFLLSADHVVSLTHAAVREIRRFDYLQRCQPPITVIPTCADLDRFVPSPQGAALNATFTLGYVGSAGTWYLFDAVAAAVRIAMVLRPSLRLLVVNRDEHAYVRDTLVKEGVEMGRVLIVSAQHRDVPSLMARMDAGIFFIKPVFSKQASAPTKLGELLGSGVPCLGNAGVGDMASILEGDRVGVALDTFDEASLRSGVEGLLALAAEPDIRERCAAAARRHFSLDDGVARYRSVYASVLECS